MNEDTAELPFELSMLLGGQGLAVFPDDDLLDQIVYDDCDEQTTYWGLD